MSQKFRLIIFCVFLCSQVWAKTIEPSAGKALGCSVELAQEDKMKSTVLKCEGIDFKQEQEFLSNKFVKWQTVTTKNDNYAVLIFSKGSHGERAVIFSLKQKKLIQEYNSAWPVEVQKIENDYKLFYTLDSDSNNHYPKHTYLFK